MEKRCLMGDAMRDWRSDARWETISCNGRNTQDPIQRPTHDPAVEPPNLQLVTSRTTAQRSTPTQGHSSHQPPAPPSIPRTLPFGDPPVPVLPPVGRCQRIWSACQRPKKEYSVFVLVLTHLFESSGFMCTASSIANTGPHCAPSPRGRGGVRIHTDSHSCNVVLVGMVCNVGFLWLSLAIARHTIIE